MAFNGISTILPIRMDAFDQTTIADFRRAALSVLTQEVSCPVELLIVDDGSPAPLTACAALSDTLTSSYVSVLRLERHHGLVYALNAGLRRARFELIARIDGDDYWRPGKLRQQLARFENEPDLTLLGTGMRVVHRNPERDSDHLRGSSWQDAIDFFARSGCPFPHGSILARKKIFELLGGYSHDSSFDVCEDFHLWGTWIRFFPVGLINEVLFEYTVSERQASAQHAEQQRRASAIVHRAFLELVHFDQFPDLITLVARSTGRSRIAIGKSLFLAWKYFDHIFADDRLLGSIRTLLPDRRVLRLQEAKDLNIERAFVFSHADGDATLCLRHLRLVWSMDTAIEGP